jgi:hypothetical protein
MHGMAEKNLITNTISGHHRGDTVICAVPKVAFFKERT